MKEAEAQMENTEIHNDTVHQQTVVRNLLIFKITTQNAQRPGPIINIKLQDIANCTSHITGAKIIEV